jgi:hypothetical protein
MAAMDNIAAIAVFTFSNKTLWAPVIFCNMLDFQGPLGLGPMAFWGNA